MKKITSCLLAATLLTPAISMAGPYAPAAGVAGSTAISKDDTSIAGWASEVVNYTPGTNLDPLWMIESNALGPAEGTAGDVVSLGRGGSITLSFENSLFNGDGYDFAIFENSFSNTFLELAWVEVSSDGLNFFRIPSFSLTPNPVGGFGSVDPTNIDGFAGKYSAGFGTPFDLDIFSGVAGIDVNDVSYIRLIDIIGDGTSFDNTPATVTIDGVVFDTGGPNPIYDPTFTFQSAGFDLDAVAALNMNTSVVPLPASIWLLLSGLVGLTAFRKRKI